MKHRPLKLKQRGQVPPTTLYVQRRKTNRKYVTYLLTVYMVLIFTVTSRTELHNRRVEHEPIQ